MWSVKKIWFQLHWFIGITAGTMLVAIGLTGAVFSFHEEILDWLNPGIASAAPAPSPALTPPELLASLQAAGEARHVERMVLFAQSDRNPQVTFAPEPGERRGTTVFVNAYTGAMLPAQKGAAFFGWVERLHRWLLLPIDIGKPVAGSLAVCLLFLSLTGLYLRWPSKPLSLRTWLCFNTQRRGRPLLWSLHSVAGTWALLVYLMLTGTGVYWGFASVRSLVDGWAGVPPRAAARAQGADAPRGAPVAPAALQLPWRSFEHAAPGWQFVQLQLPKREGQAYQFNWYGADAAHERARNQLVVQADGALQRHQRFSDLPAGRRALAAIYPLHMGTYFGLPGRIVVTLASLAMVLFAATGWMLYLDRRRKAHALAREAAALEGAPVRHAGSAGIAVVHASQSGHAQQLALRTAALLRGAGHAVEVLAIAQLNLAALARYPYALWVASTFGDGDPPDAARAFFRALQREAGPLLRQQHYGVLALGSSQYASFCGFGLRLHEQLQQAGARPLFAAVTMDGERADAWQAWRTELQQRWQVADAPAQEGGADEERVFIGWQLVQRVHCNPGSQGHPLYRLELSPAAGQAEPWEAGALVEVLACQAPGQVQAWLDATPWSGNEQVECRGHMMSLRSALSGSVLPSPASGGLDPQSLARQLQAIAPRSYSVASLPGDGRIQLWVRQSIRDGELGLASGWLTQHLALGEQVRLRVVANPGFAPVAQPGLPAIFIGNGSGYAGLRAQLLARMHHAQHDNWFIFGERQRAVDGWAEAEIGAWLAEGKLSRADFAYSRDPGELRYAQHIVRQAGQSLRDWIARGAIIYICGSCQGMAADVEQALVELLGDEAFDRLAASGRYRRDVY